MRATIGGFEIAVADAQPTFWEKVSRGAWEPEATAAIARLCAPGVAFVDIGAWVGPTALLAAACGATVTAFEPDPAARAGLEANLRANPALGARIAVHPAALSARDGVATMRARRKPGDSMSSLVAGSGEGWEVRVLSPASLLTLVPPAASRVLKIDIEGGEYAALASPEAAVLVAPPTRAAIVAFHPRLVAAPPEETAAATDRILALFAGWRVSILDGPVAPLGDPRATALARETTLLFERP